MGSLIMESSSLPLYHKRAKTLQKKRFKPPPEEILTTNSLPNTHSSSRSLTNINLASSQRVTYRRLEKIASYHYLPRVVYHGSLKKSQSHHSISDEPRLKKSDKFLPDNEFGSLDSLTSV